jgi:hypothetical protein
MLQDLSILMDDVDEFFALIIIAWLMHKACLNAVDES